MTFDPTKLTTVPWVFDEEDGTIEGILELVHHGNVNTISRAGELFNRADGQFIALARSAFDIMMRRQWAATPFYVGTIVAKNGGYAWSVADADGRGIGNPMSYADPFTALVETEKWYVQEIEKAKGGGK